MGKSSYREDRHRRDHERSRSRERRRHYADDRKHSSKSGHSFSESKSKEVSKNIEAVKSHMRSALESAVADTPVQISEAEIRKDDKFADFELSVTESANRHREIERIEEGPYRPSIFQSTAGGAGGRIKKEDSVSHAANVTKKQDAHDKAIFGPKWRDAAKQERENDEGNDYHIGEAKKEFEVAGPKFLVDSKTREEKWLKIFRERRSHLLSL